MRADPTLEPRLLLKVAPPRDPKGLIERAAVDLASPRLQDTAVIAVEAPAGFGKTSLLAQWRRALLLKGAIVGWLGADEDDDPARFTSGIALSMERASGRESFARIRRGEISSTGEINRLTEWLGYIAELAFEAVLMIDEADRLPARTVEGPLNYILSNLPPNLRIAFSARRRVSVSAADLIAHGAMIRLSADDLRFTLSETLALVRERFGARADPDEAGRIHELTCGWPLGVQLAMACFERRSESSAGPARLAPQYEDFKRYLLGTLLARRPRAEHEFLARISIVERVQAELARALTGRKDAARVLTALRETTPLLSQSAEDGWLMLHPLAREVLQEEFARLPAMTRKKVHAAAASWFEAHQIEDEAARHALKAGQKERAWALAERSLFNALERGQVGHLREWFEQAPLPRGAVRPRLLLAAGWNSALGARYDEAESFARRVLRDRRSMRDERLLANLLLSSAAIYADRMDRAEKLAARWRDAIPAHAGPIIFNDANQRAILTLYQGRPAEARAILKRAAPAMRKGGHDFVKYFHAAVEAMAYLWEGHVTAAAAVVEPALATAERNVGYRGVVTVTVAGVAALAFCECGDLQKGSMTLLNRLSAIEQLATPSGLAAGFIAASRVAAHREDEGRAFELLEELCTVAESRDMPRVQIMAYVEMLRFHSARGRAETCASLLRRLDAVLRAAHGLAGTFKELLVLQRGLATVYAARAAENWPRVIEAADEAMPVAERLRRGMDSLEFQFLRADALHATGRDARPVLEEATSLARALGLRSLLDQPPVRELRRALLGDAAEAQAASRALEAGSHSAGDEHESKAAPAGNAAQRVAPTALLTPKERQVLGLLAQRLSNKQIATALEAAQTTVKWHVKNLYSKLNAAGREHAVQRARMLGILATR